MTSRRNDLHHLLIAWIGVIPLLIRGNIANCSDALGLSTNKIADDSISATTWQPGRSDPWYGRLNNQSRRSWCAAVVDDMQYLQIDLGPKLRLITAVASQGSHNYDEWVTSYKLSYSTDGGKWKFFGKGNIPEIFDANKNRGTGVKHQINPPIVAAALRFYPVTWEGDMCMRVEAFGCDDIVRSDLGYATPTETIGDNHKSLVANYVSTAYSEALGVENSSVIQDKYLTASHHKYAYDARKGRLYNLENAWSAYPRAGNFFEISIGRQLSIITAVATQGFKNKYHEAWVISYKLSYSLWGDEWMEYIDDGEVKIFRGNNDPNTVVKNYLRHNITALCVRFWPETYYNRPGLRVELYGSKDVCQNPLGVESGDLSNVQFTASSQSPAESDAWNGRLNNGKAWCAGRNDDKQYLQVDLGRVYTVARVATQGHPVNLQWVIRYEVAYSMDNIFWRKALDESKSKTLSGNTDHNTAKEVQFYKHVTGRFLRFLPVEWNEAICMRVEVYGCEECAHPVGIERGVVPNEAFSASSWYDVDHEPWLARLYSRDGEGAWCALENDGKQYLQVDLAQIHIITGVATQGKYETSEWAIRFRAWVTNFSLSFTDDHMLWVNYTEDGVSPKVFDGNSQSIQVIRHTLLKRITSRQIRFLPVTWFGWTCMRVEVFGCKTCSSAIGMEDFHWPSESILVSSVNSGHDAAKARLFNTYTWLRGHNDKDSFLQIGNGIDEYRFTAVATQGHSTIKSAVVKFQLSFSRDGLHWFYHRENGEVRMFIGTPLVNTVAKHYLERTVTASFVRFWPKEWVGRPNMRVELYGCQVYSRSVDFSNLTSMADGYPNFYTCDGSVLTPWHGRLAIHNNSHDGPGSAWCAKSNETNNNQFLQIDLKMTKVIQAIAVQSHLPGDKWVKTFSISSSLDGLFWKQYTEWGNVKVFNGNTHRHSLVKVSIKYNLRARYLRFHPKTWNNHPCLRLEVFAKEDCIDPLGMESGQISDKDITASSALRVNYEPWLARLHSRLGEGGWCAGRSDENQYLEVDLKHPYHVRRVATQGKYSVHGCTIQDAWVTSYMMQFRRDSLDWWNYTENNAIRDFSGNINTTHVVTHHLKNPVIGRYVRFRPINWFRRICMRVEIYGCKACFQPLGMEDFSIPSKNVDSSVASNIYNVRLNYAQRNQFVGGRDKFILQIDLGHFKTVAAVATQGRYRGSHFVRIYRLAFSRLEGEWFYYKENGEVKEIQGNTNADGTVLKILHYQVVARYVRFVAVEWVDNVCLRVEIYGCEAWSDPLGIGSGLISKSKMTSSSTSGPGHEPWLAKLNTVFDTMGWCAAPSDTSPYLQINMGRVVSLTQIAVTGKSGKGMVWKFKFSLSVDGGFWRIYKTVSGEKTFIAATDYSQAFKFSIDLEVKAQFFRFLPEEWTDLPCMNVELYGFDECTMPLGLTEWIIPKEAMTASSSLGTNYAPWMGRLGAMEGGGAWCAKNNDNMQHLQIDLGYVRKVRSLQIQGKEGISRHPTLESAWVKNFTLSHSVDGITWTDHKEDGSLKVFPGNSNPHEARTVVMEVSIIGRHFRIFPKYFHRHICMRLELYGCQACESPLGMENHDIPDYALVASGTYYDPIHARLNKPDYFLLPGKKDEYVQVDTGPGGKSVTAITVRGNFASSNIEWISKFVLNYSRSGCEFFSYMEDGNMKIFQTPSDNRFYATRYRLQHNITARYFRVVLKDWINRPFIQLELYGCEACSKSYGIGNDPLPVSSSSASSSRHGHKPENAQNFTDTCSWCAEQAKGNENLQLDFGKTVVLTGIATKGHHSNDEYVSQFELEYSVDGANWFTYTRSFRLEDTRTQLSANVDNASVRKIGFLYELKARYLKIVAKAWHNGICLRVQVFGYKGCDKDLGMESSVVSNNSINASSYLGEGYEPWNARHNRHHGKGAWCAGQKATDEFIQVQFNQIHVIARVSLQKKEKTSPEDTVGKAWVTKFILAYSEDGVSWSEYSDGSGVKELTGNKIHALANTVRAQFVRIVVKEWYNHICLRMELYGCHACLEPLGVENFHIPDSSFSSSPNYLRLPKRARLGYYKNEMWAARNKNLDQFLQIDLGERKTITAIATQGNSHTYKDSRLREYYIQYSDDSSNWLDYTFEGQQKVFDGYKTQGADIRRKFFPQAIKARYIRLRATKWYDYIATKLEIYGCEA